MNIAAIALAVGEYLENMTADLDITTIVSEIASQGFRVLSKGHTLQGT